MRRRTFLTATAASTATAAMSLLTACSKTASSPGPTPSFAPMPTPSRTPMPDPPSATAVPSSFSLQPRWPDVVTSGSITAIREHYLCGVAGVDEADEARRTVPDGKCPVVVDLNGPTTWALLPDGDGAWTTRTVEAADPSSTPTEPRYMLETGPALLDETHAYLTVGVIAEDAQATPDPGLTNTLCPVDLVKVDLSDGSIAASTRLSSAFEASRIEHVLSLSFTEDRSALLISGDDSGSGLETQNIGVRLSAADLSVHFDAFSMVADPHHFSAYGEAVVGEYEGESTMIYLADGTTEPRGDMMVETVRDGWVYYYDTTYPRPDPALPSRGAAHARKPHASEVITISETNEYALEGINDRIQTDQHEVILLSRSDAFSFSVWRPGETQPAMYWEAAERTVPKTACVFGDVVYAAFTNDQSATLRLMSLSSGDDIGEVPDVVQNWAEPVAVTAWGLAASGAFYPAAEWLDS